MSSARFASPADALDLGRLLAPSRRQLWAGLAAAAAFHLAAVGVDPFEPVADRAPRPLTTKFVRREPRLTKPLELRRLPQPKRQMVRRQVQLAAARMDRVQSTAAFSTGLVVGLAAAPAVDLAGVDQRLAAAQPLLASGPVSGARQPLNQIDLSLELLDIGDLDVGRFRALVVQDPGDRQAVKGFIHFARVYSAASLVTQDAGYAGPLDTQMMTELVRKVNEWTGLTADYVGRVTFDDERLFDIPFIMPQGSPNEREMECVARYLVAGGFAMGYTSFTEGLEKYGGLVAGRDFWTTRLPDDHPIYSSYFDIRGGPPSGNYWQVVDKQWTHRVSHLVGLFIHGRLAGVASSSGNGWVGFNQGTDSDRQLMMGVNIVVYALTQEGSMTQRRMLMVR